MIFCCRSHTLILGRNDVYKKKKTFWSKELPKFMKNLAFFKTLFFKFLKGLSEHLVLSIINLRIIQQLLVRND